ncbi:hypothetical protein KGM_205200 [Danaus plexippus plexippus]|uniref:C2H2-type domain-containing protein n=1 Tax=Danaus plexippus plexippus TaxID=278856 RepID=A0A212ESJ7_DANPL|nr:hypothetical protein KGM_205200 [Danaus plexippus plexippus]
MSNKKLISIRYNIVQCDQFNSHTLYMVEDFPQTEDTEKSLAPKKKESLSMEQKRKNTIGILNNSTVMPFRWLWSCFRCFFCYEMFNKPEKLKHHQGTHGDDDVKDVLKNYCEPLVYVDVSEISCNMCQTNFNDIFQLVDHLVKEHDIEFNRDIGISMIPIKLNVGPICIFCEIGFKTFNHLVTHMKKYHKDCFNTFCSKCSKQFASYNDFCEHVSDQYLANNIKCTECDIKLNYGSLKNHMRDVHGKRYKCLRCFEYFPTHYKRSNHMAEMHNRDRIKCSYCTRTFIFQSILLRHVRDTHLKEKNAVCDVCGWRSFSVRELHSHMGKHNPGRHVKCKGCDKMFKCQRYMMRHYIKNHRN